MMQASATPSCVRCSYSLKSVRICCNGSSSPSWGRRWSSNTSINSLRTSVLRDRQALTPPGSYLYSGKDILLKHRRPELPRSEVDLRQVDAIAPSMAPNYARMQADFGKIDKRHRMSRRFYPLAVHKTSVLIPSRCFTSNLKSGTQEMAPATLAHASRKPLPASRRHGQSREFSTTVNRQVVFRNERPCASTLSKHRRALHNTQSSPNSTDDADTSRLPLAGIRVLDMTRVLAGPYCTQILGDHGAEVIKVEHPTRGDDTRAWGPPFAPYTAESGRDGPGEAAYFLAANRNKKSIGVSFQDPRGVEILHALAKNCDVLVENYLPGSLKKYKLDYETMAQINPALIYVSITGYGQTGPYSSRAGYDVMVEAEFGLMHITGERDGPPVKVGVAITDLTSGLYACNATMAALLGRAKTGKGQHVDVALSDCQTANLANIASSVLVTGKKDTGRWGTAHPSIVPYQGFKTADGDILVGGGNDKLFGIMCKRMGKEEWIEDARFATNGKRVENRVELERLIEKVTCKKTTQEWLDILEGSGMPYAAINDVQQTLQHDQSKARNMVTEVQHPSCGPMKLVSPPVKYSYSKTSVRLPPPTLGQHTDEILKDILGISSGKTDSMKAAGVIS